MFGKDSKIVLFDVMLPMAKGPYTNHGDRFWDFATVLFVDTINRAFLVKWSYG